VAAQASTEELLRLAPMGREDGVQLLALRARESHRGFVLDSQSRPLAEQIVDALDGIPLAIELAGARMHMLGPRALLERLSDRFKILRARRSTSRHSTLWDAIDWSWRLLAPAEQAALAQCSVFAGGFDLTAAESVIGLPESDWTVLDAIEGLREHSLLQLGESPLAPGVPRFRLLSSVRAFAAVHLAELDAHGQAAERHCAYFVEAVLPLHRTVGHADHGSSLSLVELELPNLIASMNHALKHQPDTAVDLIGGMRTVFFLRGPRHRTAGLLDRLDLAVLSPKKQATALAFRAIGLMDVEDMSGAEAALQSARAAAVESGEPGIQAYVLMRLGDLCRHQGQSEPAEQYYAQTRGLARDAGDSHTEISALRRLGMLARARDDAQTAMSFCEEALAAAEASGAELLGASVCNSMGLLLMDSGQLDAAQHRFEQTLVVAEGAEARGLVVSARANLGVVLVRRGEPAEAMLLLKQAREEAEAIDHKMVLAQVEECIAEAELALG
jgi:tetratricopeptide (TPR) repeat protein